ncbi:hypothetical protein IQ252_08315 [Tychonema sp. LEGE 07203]|nr:hypothetical protein [Tychonema sp. LEGE 07203]
MIGRLPIKNLSKPVLDVELFPYTIRELNEQEQESISGGGIKRLQEEFAAELAILGAIALPSLLGQVNKAKQS